MTKKFVSFMLTIAIFMMHTNSVFAANPMVTVLMNSNDDRYTVEYGDKSKTSDAPIVLLFINGDIISDADVVIKNGTTLVPLRIVSDKLGASTKWNPATKSVDIVKANTKIQMTIGSKNIVVNGKQSEIRNAPEIIDSLTYVPLRAIVSGFGAEVGYVDNLMDGRNELKAVYVQDKKEKIQITEKEAVEKAKNLYFLEFLPTMREYILETRNIDVNDINTANIHSKLNKEYTGKCIADLGEYYYIELFNQSMEYVLVDKYTGECYPVSSYSVVLFEIDSPNSFSSWALHYQ